MKKLTLTVIATFAAVWLMSCTQVVRVPEAVEQTVTKKVFTEVTNDIVEPGKVNIVVKLSIKTRLPGYYLLESKNSLTGKPGYPFIITVDGQSVAYREDGEIEKTSKYDAKGILAPEGGEGRRYTLVKILRMQPGQHRIEIDLPEEKYTCRVNVTLAESSVPYLLELKPEYRRSGKQRPTFLQGLRCLEPFLNGSSRKS